MLKKSLLKLVNIFYCTLGFVGALCAGDIPSSIELNKLERWDKKATVTLATNGRTNYVILVSKDASESEKHAAQELSRFLNKTTKVVFSIVHKADLLNQPVIAIGSGAAKQVIPTLDISGLGQDGTILHSSTPHIILTGGKNAARGTLYAVYRFLEDAVGCRWWTPDVSDIPYHSKLVVPSLQIRYVPIFEYREIFMFHTFNNPDWAVRNMLNGQHYGLDKKRGDYIGYTKKFVHSFNTLVPPKKYFSKHPEWFSEIKGKRIGPPTISQLCLTNPALLDFCIEQVRKTLRNSPPGTIMSVSQNDCFRRCFCKQCLKVEKEERSPSGSLLRFVNAIADAVREEFPQTSIDTLAYQYTRKPPVITKPRPNVIVRLCSIECSFEKPLEDPANHKFADDIRNWSKICDRIYVWNYITNFNHYLLPFPNLRVLGPNVRFFAKYGVRGVFEQGNGQSLGEFSELRAWVLAKLLWNPSLNDKVLIREFIEGYYSTAAPYIMKYINLLHNTVEKTGNYKLCLLPAENLFIKAEDLVKKNPKILRRVQRAHLSVQYAILINYEFLKRRSKQLDMTLGPYDYYRDRFFAFCKKLSVTRIAERGEGGTIRYFRHFTKLMQKRTQATPPEICKNISKNDWFELQEDSFRLAKPGLWVKLREDNHASNGLAAWMPANHNNWAVRLFIPRSEFLNVSANGIWDIYVAVRVERKGEGKGIAFDCGIFDRRDSLSIKRKIAIDRTNDLQYRFFKIASTHIKKDRVIWVSPTNNEASVKGIWIDRIVFVRNKTVINLKGGENTINRKEQ